MAGELASVLLPHCLNQEAAFLSRDTKIGSTLRFSPWVLTRHNVARTLSSFLPFFTPWCHEWSGPPLEPLNLMQVILPAEIFFCRLTWRPHGDQMKTCHIYLIPPYLFPLDFV